MEPRYRYQLKGKIISSGYKTVKEFAKRTGITEARLSSIIRGYEYPRQKDFRALAQGLNLTFNELEAML